MSKRGGRRKTSATYEAFHSRGMSQRSPFKQNTTDARLRIIQSFYRRILMEMSANRFKWNGLPDTVDPRFLEMELLRSGLVVFYWDEDYDRFMALRASGSGRTNMYDNPTSFTVSGGTMLNKTLKGNDCIPIWANYTRMSDMDIIEVYATRLADIDRTLEINSHNMRQGKVVVAPENERLSWMNIIRQMDQGEQMIWGTNALDLSALSVFDLGVDPLTVEKLSLYRTKVWAECMTALGINNANQEKAERVQTAEVEANNEQVELTKAVAMNTREEAAWQINMKYDLEVSVDFVLKSDNSMPAVMGESYK